MRTDHLRQFSFWIALRVPAGAHEQVRGWALGEHPRYAMHRAEGYGGLRWDITDLTTGMAVSSGTVFWKKAEAEAWLRAQEDPS